MLYRDEHMRAFFFLVVVYVARLVVHLITFLSKVFWIQKFPLTFIIVAFGCQIQVPEVVSELQIKADPRDPAHAERGIFADQELI